jgi:hypothetical protein
MPTESKILKKDDNLTSYVTQGTVQIERRTKAEAEIFINPTPDYAVKHNGKDYIVFVGAESLQAQSQLFEKTKGFPIEGEYFIEMLTEAAFQRTKIEIRMNADCTKIAALKIPAMP